MVTNISYSTELCYSDPKILCSNVVFILYIFEGFFKKRKTSEYCFFVLWDVFIVFFFLTMWAAFKKAGSYQSYEFLKNYKVKGLS